VDPSADLYARGAADDPPKGGWRMVWPPLPPEIASVLPPPSPNPGNDEETTRYLRQLARLAPNCAEDLLKGARVIRSEQCPGRKVMLISTMLTALVYVGICVARYRLIQNPREAVCPHDARVAEVKGLLLVCIAPPQAT